LGVFCCKLGLDFLGSFAEGERKFSTLPTDRAQQST
jgi:hypothetical protein